MDFGQIVIDYWWIFLLALIADLVLSKNLLRFAISTLVTIFFSAIFWFMFLSPALSLSNSCFSKEVDKAKFTNQQVLTIPEDERAEFVCTESTASFERLKTCLTQSKQKSPLGFSIYSKLPQYKKAIDKTVKNHNLICPDAPVLIPNI